MLLDHHLRETYDRTVLQGGFCDLSDAYLAGVRRAQHFQDLCVIQSRVRPCFTACTRLFGSRTARAGNTACAGKLAASAFACKAIAACGGHGASSAARRSGVPSGSATARPPAATSTAGDVPARPIVGAVGVVGTGTEQH